jgi:hypothetical protein
MYLFENWTAIEILYGLLADDEVVMIMPILYILIENEIYMFDDHLYLTLSFDQIVW